jgi:osmotically-inducible protein OsmY
MKRLLATLTVVLFCISTCAAVFAQSKSTSSASDDVIWNQVKRKLANDPDVRGGAFDVEVKSGVVTIRGKVEKQKYKDKAEHLTKKVKGVKQVVNELRIEPR